MNNDNPAPGGPGLSPSWAPGPKSAVGTALSDKSNVWFTIGHGILNEVFWPTIDTPSIRDCGLLVAGEDGYFASEQTGCDSTVTWQEPGVPAFTITNAARDGRYVISKEVIANPERDVILQRIRLDIKRNELADPHLYVLLAPHLGNHGGNNNAWTMRAGEQTVLIAQREDYALALACSSGFTKASAGYVGSSDGWQDIAEHKQMTLHYSSALDGNVALTGEVDASRDFTLALGFGNDPDQAKENALASLKLDFQKIKTDYINGWRDWHKSLKGELSDDFAKNSLAVLKSHESKNPGGGLVAGLASPWGYSRGDDDPIGYHIVWTRDMVETAGGLLAGGAGVGVREIINYLESTQREDGHWPQNMFIDGTPFWRGIQMDETALPITLVNLAHHEHALTIKDLEAYWPMVKKAASFLVRNGPVTQQDRWEEDPGYTPFTVAAEIAALLAAADMADLNREPTVASYLRDTADNWHDALDRWMYTSGGDWAKRFGVDGYYERIASVDTSVVARFANTVHVKNVPSSDAYRQAAHLVSPDALALVRFGLRAADDPRIQATVKVNDALLKVDTPDGATWHRYNDDGYGEHEDGSAFDGTGIGRGWPLLTGERAHYELARGDKAAASQLKNYMEHFACDSGLLPEQVWDSPPIPEHELALGRPSGSAMPLAWAHAEYLKLARSLERGKIFDLPPQTVGRYLDHKVTARHRAWRFNHKIRTMAAGKILRIETLEPAKIHWSCDGWQTVTDSESMSSGLGVHFTDLDTWQLAAGAEVDFTIYWQHQERWEGTNFSVTIEKQGK